MVCICWDEFDYKPLFFVVPYLLADTLFHWFIDPNMFSTTVVPIVFILICGAYKRLAWVDLVKRTVILFLSTALFQYTMISLKFGEFFYVNGRAENLTMYKFLIDMLLFLLVIFLYRRESKREKENCETSSISRQLVVHSKRNSMEESNEFADWLNTLPYSKQLKALGLLILFQLLQWAFIIFVSSLNGRAIEAIILTTSFIVHGFIVKRKWHSDSVAICTTISAVAFYLASASILPFQISVLLPVVIGAGMAYGAYQIVQYTNPLKTFSVSTCTEEEMRERCTRLGKSKEYADFCVAAFVHKTRRKEIALEMGLSENTIKEYKRKRRNELEGYSL